MYKFWIVVTLLFSKSFPVFTQMNWSGEIKKVNGTNHITNLDEPIYYSPKLKLKKVWQIGGEYPGFIMNTISSIDIDETDRIYVTDTSEKNVKVFSPTGEHLFTFGRQGQGPGEFRAPRCLTILKNNVLVIDPLITYPMNRFILFDFKGNYINSYNLDLKNTSYSKDIDLNNRESLLSRHKIQFSKLFFKNCILLFTYSTIDMKYKENSLWIYRLKTRERTKIITKKKIDPRLINLEKQNERMFIDTQWCFNKNGNIYYIEDFFYYKIEVFDSSGVLKSIIRRDFNLPLKTKDEYKKDIKDGQKWEEFYQKAGKKVTWETLKEKPIIYNLGAYTRGMFCDDKNNLWVLTNESYPSKKSKGIFSTLFKKESNKLNEKPTRFTFDVFNSDGKFLMKVPFDGNQPRCFVHKRCHIYFADLGVDGFPWLYKYKICEL